jgi:hypothetical protein
MELAHSVRAAQINVKVEELAYLNRPKFISPKRKFFGANWRFGCGGLIAQRLV